MFLPPDNEATSCHAAGRLPDAPATAGRGLRLRPARLTLPRIAKLFPRPEPLIAVMSCGAVDALRLWHRQRTFSAAHFCRHRLDDRFFASARQPPVAAIRGGRPGRHLFHSPACPRLRIFQGGSHLGRRHWRLGWADGHLRFQPLCRKGTIPTAMAGALAVAG